MPKSILRINEDIQRELSVLLRNIKDPRVNQGMISITAVHTSNDLSQAKIYLSVFIPSSGDSNSQDDTSKPELNKKEFMKGLKSASGFLRSELGRALSLRHTPSLHFELDKSLEHGSKINTILSNLDIEADE